MKVGRGWRLSLKAAAWSIIWLIGAVSIPAQQIVTLEEVGSALIPNEYYWANDISADGSVFVGDFQGGGFRFVGNEVTIIPEMRLFGISDDGEIAVGVIDHGEQVIEPAMWVDGTVTALGYPFESTQAWTRSISGNGQVIAGTALDEDSGWATFKWEGSAMSTVPYFKPVNLSHDGSIVVGNSGSFSGDGYTLENGLLENLETLPGHMACSPADITDDKSIIVGGSIALDWVIYACRWVNGSIEALEEIPGSISSVAWRVSGDGSVILGYNWTDSYSGLVIWSAVNDFAPVSLHDLLLDNGIDPQIIDTNVKVLGAIGDDGMHPHLSEDGTTIIISKDAGYPQFIRIKILDEPATFGPYDIIDGFADTEDWLGVLYVELAPWVYCYDMECWLFILEEHVGEDGGWAFVSQ